MGKARRIASRGAMASSRTPADPISLGEGEVVEPSAKGSLVLGSVVSVRRQRDRGLLSAETLAARLSPAAVDLVDQKIDVSRWYPIGVFCELLDVDWEVGGERDPDYMRGEGRRAAARLFDSGIYHQLDYAERAEKVQTRERLVRQSKLISTLTGTLFNFLRFEVQIEPDRLEIHFHDAGPFSEALRFTTEGFLNEINARQKSTRRWSSERLRPDHVMFRLSLPSRLSAEG